jgi:CDP-6-deoxy-D-xylo-4-hexulose-3-dehydrase
MDVVSNYAVPVIARKMGIIGIYRKKFADNGVEIRPMIAGDMGKQPIFKKYAGKSKNQKNAEYIHNNSFYFGNDPELTGKELNLLKRLLEKRN